MLLIFVILYYAQGGRGSVLSSLLQVTMPVVSESSQTLSVVRVISSPLALSMGGALSIEQILEKRCNIKQWWFESLGLFPGSQFIVEQEGQDYYQCREVERI